MGEDIRGAITVRTDIKGTELLNKISRPSFLTKPKISAGFTPSGSFTLTHPAITVRPMAMEFEQNARAFGVQLSNNFWRLATKRTTSSR